MNEITEKEIEKQFVDYFPDYAARHISLEIFADCILAASQHGRDKWLVQFDEKQNKIRLLVGHNVICSLSKNTIWMSLDNTSPQYKPTDAGVWAWDEDSYPEYKSIKARNGYYSPDPNSHATVWPGLSPFVFRAIAQSARKRGLDPRSLQGHAPAILRYVRNQLNRFIPDPRFD